MTETPSIQVVGPWWAKPRRATRIKSAVQAGKTLVLIVDSCQ